MNCTVIKSRWSPLGFTKIIKSLILVVTVLGSYVSSQPAVAACTLASAHDYPITRDFGSGWTYEIDSSLPTGSVLATFIIHGLSATTSDFDCTGDAPLIRYESGFPYSGDHIYQTGILGIGMKIELGSVGFLPSEIISVRHPTTGYYTTGTYQPYRIQLIKSGYIPAGGQIFWHPFTRSFIINHGNIPHITSNLTQPLNIVLKRPTCAVNIPNFTVDLGTVSPSDLDASGRTLPTHFSIDLNCEGDTGSADVHVTLSDANNPANATRQLGLSPDSTAQGIALEVNNRLGLVSFGPDLEGLGNPGQWLDGATGVGSYSIPLSVNYVRLPGPIKGGTANSGITYTLNYD